MKEPNQNLRDIEINGNSGKDVNSTSMLDATASETPDTVSGDNVQKEYIAANPKPGALGAFGRC